MERMWFERFMRAYHEEMAYRGAPLKKIVDKGIQNIFKKRSTIVTPRYLQIKPVKKKED